jgi:hypothetical protein
LCDTAIRRTSSDGRESPRRRERDHDEQQRGNREKEPKLREQVMRRELEQMIVTG